ncbi:hypothetical protein [Mesorhizobium silamurunense]|uniref:hypothetical protein n=1 Tax=Mesorhizobium silamurunense TaxID=499528 RepID=UPI00177E00DB|nr:hypothetical protein [Mesorhizobium silamurunense]
MANATHKLNIHRDGKKIFEREYETFGEMMDAAPAIYRAEDAKGGFVVAQSQVMGPHGWSHLAILS